MANLINLRKARKAKVRAEGEAHRRESGQVRPLQGGEAKLRTGEERGLPAARGPSPRRQGRMKRRTGIVKRSLAVAGHRTSISRAVLGEPPRARPDARTIGPEPRRRD